LSGITEELFFTDPFHDHPRNRHNPRLQTEVTAIRADRDLKLAALDLKSRFCSRAETMLHGDLHTGSVMVTEADSRVIDAEFALYGPIGFDIGSLLANFWMAYFAQAGQRNSVDECESYGAWILGVIEEIWGVFAAEFSHLWRTERSGILGCQVFFEEQDDLLGAEIALQSRLRDIWHDTLGFAGIEMHRRILGLAHAAELDTITDEGLRATCERKALVMGRQLAVHRQSFPTITAVSHLAATIESR
jgi:5-methylthioribose kinase